MYITSAKFQEEQSNFLEDIVYFVIFFALGTFDDVISFYAKNLISPERYFKNENTMFLSCKRLSNKL